MVSTPEVFTDDSTISPMKSTPEKKPNGGKSLCLFTNILDMKRKNAARQVVNSKSKRKVIKFGTTPWPLKQKRKGNSKINDQIKKSMYNWSMHHLQVVQSPIVNDCLKMIIGGHTEPQLVLELLLKICF